MARRLLIIIKFFLRLILLKLIAFQLIQIQSFFQFCVLGLKCFNSQFVILLNEHHLSLNLLNSSIILLWCSSRTAFYFISFLLFIWNWWWLHDLLGWLFSHLDCIIFQNKIHFFLVLLDIRHHFTYSPKFRLNRITLLDYKLFDLICNFLTFIVFIFLLTYSWKEDNWKFWIDSEETINFQALEVNVWHCLIMDNLLLVIEFFIGFVDDCNDKCKHDYSLNEYLNIPSYPNHVYIQMLLEWSFGWICQ